MGLKLKRGKWQIDYYDSKGKRFRETIGPNKLLAERVLMKRKLEIAEGKFLDKKDVKRIKFKDFSIDFIELHCKRNHKVAIGRIKFLNLHFGDMYLNEIKVVDIEKYKEKRIKECKGATVNRDLAILKCMFNRAKDWEKYDEDNPMRKVKLIKEEPFHHRYLEKEEIAKLIPHCKGNVGKMVIVALNTGMRRGEIFNLKWRDINFNEGNIYLFKTKSGKKRMIPINNILANALISIRKHDNSPYVFCKRNGEKYRDIRTAYWTILKRAGLPKIRFHDLRHTYASHLVMSGVDLNTVRELLGHADLKTTLIYSHLSQDHKKRAVDSLYRQMDSIWTPKKKEEPNESNKFLTTVQI